MNLFLNRLKTLKISAEQCSSKLIRSVKEDKLLIRLTTALVLTTWLLPVLFVGNSVRVAASTSAPKTIVASAAPLVAPPASFIASPGTTFNSLTDTAFASIVSLNQSLTSGYQFAADAINPQPPDGLALAKIPTIAERISASLSSLVAPLVAVSPANNSSSTFEPPPPPPPAPGIGNFDFDYDGKTDAARWQPSTGEWRYKSSSSGSIVSSTLGTATAFVPADYDNDGKTDPATFTDYAGLWKIRLSSANSSNPVPPQITNISPFGQSGDKPFPGKYDNDNIVDLAVWRPSTGVWYVRQSSNSNQVVSTSWGQAGDVPVPGDYDGDGRMDFAVFRPSSGTWYILPANGNSYFSLQWGSASDIPVPADYDGDGKTDCAIYRPSTGTWYAYKSSTNNGAYLGKTWGNYGDQPVPADYDADGKADFAVWRPTTGVWYIVKSADATFNTYAYDQLGIAGDVAAPSAYLRQIGGQVLTYDLANARLAPKNATGDTNLYSRNFGWSTSLVNLPGRAGLDAGFGISYNSLVWTKEPTSNTMVFDADHANVSPGFRFGFPTIEPPYYNGLTQRFSYLMVTPSGSRVEFRQVAASNVYEAEDSSYAQLTVVAPPPVTGQTTTAEQLTLVVRTTDGTQMSYDWRGGAYRLNQIKDRNGNFITIVYDNQYGLLQSVTDTLGRVININYDSDFYPTSVTQNWQTSNGAGSSTVTHTYATFTYGYTPPMSPSFDASLTVFGPGGGINIKVLSQITYDDGTSTTFEYNPYGQVWRVRNVAADSSVHKLNYVRNDLQSPASGQTDCPRFSTTYNWTEKFNLNAGVEQETVVHNFLTTNGTFTAGNETLSPADVVEVYMDNAPHNPHSKIYYYAAGNWQEGLPFGTEDFADGSRQRWTRTVWTQDTTTLYKVNPRVTETKVGDQTNTKRTKFYYLMQTNSTVASQFGLVNKVEVYDTNQTTVLKTTETDYNPSSTYQNLHILGLPSDQRLYDQNGVLMLKVSYLYDGGDFSGTEQNINTVIQHDNTNYSATFIAGRGNLTSTTRCDAGQSTATSCGGGITSTMKYNTAGGMTAQITPGSGSYLTRQINISYLDSFNDTTIPRNTYAYPTKITDPANNFSQVKYRFDIGASIWAKFPALQISIPGRETTREFDAVGRILRETIVNTGAYVRYEYPLNGVQLKSYATVTNGLGEAASENWTDGAGRIRQSIATLPGSTGGWSGVKTEYDIFGRAKSQTVPTEVSANETTSVLTPTGDDNRGNDAQGPVWLWNSQEYDWKGRVTRQVNTDGTDKLISYQGCGCAGGEVTTMSGELVPRPDQPENLTRRSQKNYADILGRIYKNEILNWDGTVYSTTKKNFNGRDQETLVRQYAGTDTSSTFQDTTTEYDGFGRMKKTHKPQQQDSNGAATYTTYSYNPDNNVQSITDARGASINYIYSDPRGYITNVSYSGSNIPVTSSLIFGYDNAGNRISMQDGLGTVTYGYDQLSRLTSETRQFNESLTDSSVPSGGFRMEYSYSLGGQLKSYKDPYNREFQFGLDQVGRDTSITGMTTYAGITSYSSNYQYRAFGLLKQISYGNQTNAAMTYNNRLQPESYRLNDATQTLFGKDYYYTTPGNNDNDGLLKKSVHFDATMTSTEQSKRNQYNAYDAFGRTVSSASGELGSTPFGSTYTNGSYQQTYNYDEFNNLTYKHDRDFGFNGVGCSGCPRSINYTETIVNNRTQSSNYTVYVSGYSTSNYQYDNDGRLINRDGDLAQFDAAGRMVFNGSQNANGTYGYDGDGNLLKWVQTGSGLTSNYYVKSTVFKANVLELDNTGAMSKEFIFSATGSKVAFLKDNEVIWLHEEPSGKESYQIKQDRTAYSKVTYDPTSVTPTNNGYSGGAPCPPSSCYSPENSAMLAQTNRGFDGLERLTQWRNAQWQQSNQFEILRIGLLGIRQVYTPGNNVSDPPPGYVESDDPLRVDSFATKDSISFEFFFLPPGDNYYENWRDFYMKYYVNPYFDECGGANYAIKNSNGDIMAQMGKEQAALALAASTSKVSAAEIAAQWLRESNWQLTPGGDAGPAQLTSWWRNNQPKLIVGDAYGSWKGRTTSAFDGNVADNIATLGNIIASNKQRLGGSFYNSAYWYGPGVKKDKKGNVISGYPRDKYANEVVNNLNFIKPFFDCLIQKGS